jgi:hypothetical protein
MRWFAIGSVKAPAVNPEFITDRQSQFVAGDDSPPVFANIDGAHGRLVLLVLPAMLRNSATTDLALSPRLRGTFVMTPILITHSSGGAGV